MLKAVIFDMDGVIIDSEPLHTEATLALLKEFDVSPPLSYFSQFVGTTAESTLSHIKEEFNLPITLEEMISRDQNLCKEVYERRGMIPIPGVIDCIKSLYKDGVKLAIASSSTMHRIETVAKAFGITKYFQKFISGADLPHSKPQPDIFLKALEELGVSHKESVIIEDSLNGCLAAKAANIACVGFLNPNSINQDLFCANVAVESMETINFRFLNDVLLRANGIPLTICDTKRLIIRELSVEDIKELYNIYQNKEAYQYIDEMEDYLEIEIEKHKAYIKNVYAFYGYGLWGVFSKTTKALIGRCGIQNQTIDGKTEIELSYMLDQQHWGYGYALECCKSVLHYAYDTLDIQRVAAVIDKRNQRSIHVAQNLCMILEKEIFYHGKECLLYAVDLEEQKCKNARNQSLKTYDKKPDTSVYSKRYNKNSD